MLSRVADSLYWMGRYIERAEHTARVLDVQLDLTLDQTPEQASRRWCRALTALSAEVPEKVLDAYPVVAGLTFDPENPSSIATCIRSARENARQTRELISSEMWEMLNRLYLWVERTRSRRDWIQEPHAFFQEVKEGAHLFAGVTDSTMNRGQGWQFITIGRTIERASQVSSLLAAHEGTEIEEPHRTLEWVSVLRCCTGFEAYCKVHGAAIDPMTIIAFLLKDGEFPRSVRFSAETLHYALRNLAHQTGTRGSPELERRSGRLRASLEFRPMEEIIERGTSSFLEWVVNNLSGIHFELFRTYISNPLRLSAETELA